MKFDVNHLSPGDMDLIFIFIRSDLSLLFYFKFL